MKWILLLLIFVSCQQKLDKSKWPFPEARKCGDLYKGEADLAQTIIDELDDELKLARLDNDLVKIDSVTKARDTIANLMRMYSDSSYYFYNIIDGK
jgi:hypothetical protein